MILLAFDTHGYYLSRGRTVTILCDQILCDQILIIACFLTNYKIVLSPVVSYFKDIDETVAVICGISPVVNFEKMSFFT